MGKGIVIPYQDTIVKPQGPTDLVVYVHFFSDKEARIHKATPSAEEQSSGLFLCSEPGCQMVFKKFSDLESHLSDVGEHRQERRGSETVYMTNSEQVGRKNSILLRTTRRSAAH